jgi:hypothetical protein
MSRRLDAARPDAHLLPGRVGSQMGEAKRKKQSFAEMLAGNPGCIYCSGAATATTMEHMPPRIVFEGKQRPKGLEFPTCERCNCGTSHTDLVAGMLARFWPDADSQIQQKDAKKIFGAIANNIPELLREMDTGRAGEKLARKQHNLPDSVYPLRADGPILSRHVFEFAAKLGFALHYDLTGAPIPNGGGVQVMWFSNVQALNGQIPSVFFDMLPSPSTLEQGKKSVADQFKYSYAPAEEGHMLYFATFNRSFAVAGVTALDRTVYLEKRNDGRFPIFVPGDFVRPQVHNL